MVLLNLLVDPNLENLEDGAHLIKSINLLVVRVVERSDHTSIICALIRLLHDCVGSVNVSPKFVELVMKCLWKVVKLLPDWIEDVDLDEILCSIHKFLKEYPTASWKERPSDLPVRTVKTVLHCMAKLQGNKIMSHFTLIKDPKESEVEAFLNKLLKSGLKRDDSTGRYGSARKDGKSPRKYSKSAQDQLSDIFKKIGSKEHTKDGLALLYEFKQQYPEADIEPFLRKSSQFFQDYIERGLRAIDMDKKNRGGMATTPSGMTPTRELYRAPSAQSVASSASSMGILDMGNNPNDGGNPQAPGMALYYLERLRELQARAGIDQTALDSKLPSSAASRTNNINNNINTNTDMKITNPFNAGETALEEKRSPLPHSRSSDGLSASSMAEVENLRKRLEKVKSGACA